MIAVAASLLLLAAPDVPPVQTVQATAAIEVSLQDGKTAKPRTVRAKRGDEVTLRIVSDRTIALHLHGYDIERTAEPDKPAIFSFTAKITGRFAMEEHPSENAKTSHAHAPAILYVEVLPK
jgi:hypothetical protein